MAVTLAGNPIDVAGTFPKVGDTFVCCPDSSGIDAVIVREKNF